MSSVSQLLFLRLYFEYKKYYYYFIYYKKSFQQQQQQQKRCCLHLTSSFHRFHPPLYYENIVEFNQTTPLYYI